MSIGGIGFRTCRIPWRPEVLCKVVVSCVAVLVLAQTVRCGDPPGRLRFPRWALIKWLRRVSVGLEIHAEGSLNGSSKWQCSAEAVCGSCSQVPVNPVSLREGELDLDGIILYAVVRVQVFLEYTATDAFMYSSTPGPFGDGGDKPRWGPMAESAACCTQYIRCCPLFPVQSQSAELLATTEGE